MTGRRSASIPGFVALFLAAGLAFPRAAAAFTPDPKDEAAVRHLKEVLWPKAYFEQDAALLDRILADDFQMIDAEGTWTTKAEQLERVRRSKPSYDSLKFVIRRLEIFENGTAIVAGQGIARGRDEKGPYVMEYQSSNVLIKRDGVWRAVASHVSGVQRKPE
jgi:ketosteroid isomerase-like protein